MPQDPCTPEARQQAMPTILIGADLCPIEGNRSHFESGDAENLFHDLLPELTAADLVVANLECPLIESPSPIAKTGPIFGESAACIAGIRAGGVDVLGLANNHILDHGDAGLRYTLEVCDQAGIGTVGAGENLAAARRILVRQIGGVRVGILAMAEFEFSIAIRNSWGANPLDIIDFMRNVREHRSTFDYLVVLVHGAAEFHVPTPRIQDTCRFFIEMGANAVIVQHPHCLGGYEEYQGGHIVYGQGALVMDEAIYRELQTFHEGFLVKLRIESGGRSRLELIPFTQSMPVPGARRMTGEREQRFRSELEAKARAVSDPARVRADWEAWCREREHRYVSALLGHGRILRRLNGGGAVERWLVGPRAMLGVRNVLCCETHREALQTIFESRRRRG